VSLAYNYDSKGYYEVNGKAFANKLEAIVYANDVGWDGINWNFNQDVWDSVAWLQEPPEDILTLYKERAQQLRDTYDRIVVFVSGGSDSTTVLQSFINNNIPIDDIFVFGAFSAEENIKGKLKQSDPGFFTREVDYCATPLINEALKQQPHINVIKWDWTEYIMNSFNDLDWIWKVGGRFGANMCARSNFHRVYKQHRKLEENGTSVAFVYGIDKPRLVRDNNAVYVYFIDQLLTTSASSSNNISGRNWEHDEFFFWSSNFPSIVQKQSHLVYNYLKKYNNMHVLPKINNINNAILWHALRGWHALPIYYKLISDVIYPHWNPNTWQIEKPKSPTYNSLETWFINSNTEAFTKWENSINEVSRIVGTKWLMYGDINNGLKECNSPFYKITDI